MIREAKGIRPFFHALGDVWRFLVGRLGHPGRVAPWRERPPAGARDGAVERPWRFAAWEIRSVCGPLGSSGLAGARARGIDVARHTLGEAVWRRYCRQGFLDVRSAHIPGLTYRLRAGRRIELRWDSPEAARLIPWPARGYLCVQPTYLLPAVAFLAQLYLYLRDREEEVIRVAVPQAADGPIRRVP